MTDPTDKLEAAFRQLELSVTNRLTAIETVIKDLADFRREFYDHKSRVETHIEQHKHIPSEVNGLKEREAQQRGGFRALAIAVTVVQAIVSILLFLWVNGKL